MEEKTLYCTFYPYCLLGIDCTKRLTVAIFNKALADNKPINRSDCFDQLPKCYIKKEINNDCT